MHRIKSDALFIIDGSYLLYRSFFAIKALRTSSGHPTNATYGFCRAIKKILDDFSPTHLVVVWDGKAKTQRHEKYPAYKATRQKAPNELFIQKDDIFRFLQQAKVPQLTVETFEGDDIIAGLTERFRTHQSILVCPDKDMFQLLSEHVLVFDPFKDRIVDTALFKSEHGFESTKVPFYYALLGDSSDNIPGVDGIGKKGAQELVMQFDSLDDLYKNLDKVPKERTRNLLAEQKEQAYLSYDLFLLNPPTLELALQDVSYEKTFWAGALPFFKEMQFGSLIKSALALLPHQPPAGESNTSLFGEDSAPQQPVSRLDDSSPDDGTLVEKPWKLGVVTDQAALDELVKIVKSADWFAMDTETTGAFPLQDTLVGLSLAVNTKEAFYVPVGHEGEQQLDRTVVLDTLRPIFENKRPVSVMHNAKFDQIVMEHAGISMPPVAFDTILAANLLRTGNSEERINLKALSASMLGEPMRKFKDVLGKKYTTFAQVPLDEGATYAAHDALQTYKLKLVLEKKLEQEPTLKKYFYDIEMPFYRTLMRMEMVGIPLDIEKIHATEKAVDKEIAHIEKKITSTIEHRGTAAPINLNAPRQIEKLLFDDLGLPVVKKSDKGHRSTDQKVLEELSAQHPIPGLILTYRELTKLKTTYLSTLPGFVNPETGRIHTNFSQTMVATGRLASSDPNLQNIPAGEGFGLQIREAFHAPRGTTFLSADYAQVELRILAHLSQDPTLIKVFLGEHDIHAETASQLLEVPLDQVTHDQRQLGKRINFSIIYGVTPFGLARDLKIKQSDAKHYIEKYFARFPGVATWMENTVQQAVKNGYVETWLGRRRYIPELQERNKTLFEAGRRMAINTPVQGTQAELMKGAMLNLDQTFINQNLEARMVLQIHDELIIQVPHDELAAVEKAVQQELGGIVTWSVPLKVTTRTGKTWAAVTK